MVSASSKAWTISEVWLFARSGSFSTMWATGPSTS